MTRPATYPDWDTNGTNTSTPTSGHKSDGYATNEIPTSAELNGQLNLIGSWIRFQDVDVVSVSQTPEATAGPNWVSGIALPTDVLVPTINSGDIGYVACDIDLPADRRLLSVTFALYNGGTADLAFDVRRFYSDVTYHNPDLAALTSGASVTINGGTKTYTRASGSFIDDGFVVGDVVRWSGFTNPSNNLKDAVITSLTPTVMTHSAASGISNASATADVGTGSDVVGVGGAIASPAAAWTDYTLNLAAITSGATVTVNSSAKTFTRGSGSYITDGFSIGNTVTWTGFTNGGNNLVGGVITALSATVMTIGAATGLVNETKAATAESIVISGDDNSLALFIGAAITAGTVYVANLRYSYTRTPQ